MRIACREPGRLPRQVGLAHQEAVDRARALAAFADRPHHERLAAAHVAGREHLGHVGRIAAGEIGRCLGVAAVVLVDAEALDPEPRADVDPDEVGELDPVTEDILNLSYFDREGAAVALYRCPGSPKAEGQAGLAGLLKND